LILRKITVATRCPILRLKCSRSDFGCTPDPAGRSLSAPPDSLAGIKGISNSRAGVKERRGKRKAGEGRGERRGRERKVGEVGERRGREWTGGDPVCICKFSLEQSVIHSLISFTSGNLAHIKNKLHENKPNKRILRPPLVLTSHVTSHNHRSQSAR